MPRDFGAQQAVAGADEVVGRVHFFAVSEMIEHQLSSASVSARRHHAVNPANPVVRRACVRARYWHLGESTDHLPSVALIPSHTAPTNPATNTVMTAFKT
jgi:hypothetical protein